jgi:hypothetical protein
VYTRYYEHLYIVHYALPPLVIRMLFRGATVGRSPLLAEEGLGAKVVGWATRTPLLVSPMDAPMTNPDLVGRLPGAAAGAGAGAGAGNNVEEMALEPYDALAGATGILEGI